MKPYTFTGVLRYPFDLQRIIVQAFNKVDAYYLIMAQLINDGTDTKLLESINHEYGAVYLINNKVNEHIFLPAN